MEKPVEFDSSLGLYIFQCPHCDCYITVQHNQINCKIFRHGFFYRKTPQGIMLTQQMNPHTPKQECERLLNEGVIIGCGKPFRLVGTPNNMIVEICDYI